MPFDPMPLLLASVPMIGWGAIQLLAARLSRDVGSLRAGMVVQGGGLVVTALLVPLFFSMPASINWAGLVFMGVTGVVDYLLLYYALSHGAVSIVAPIFSSWGLISAVMGIAVGGEPAGPFRVACILGITAGLLLLSVDPRALRRLSFGKAAPGAVPALIVALGYGVTFYWLKDLIAQMGWYFTTLGTRLFVVATFVPIGLALRRQLRAPVARWPWAVAAAIIVLDVAAFTTYNLALTRYQVSLVSIIASASPLVSLVLARFFLDERLSRLQLAGAVLTIVGIIALQVPG